MKKTGLFLCLFFPSLVGFSQERKISAPVTLEIELELNPYFDSLFRDSEIMLWILYNPKNVFSNTETKHSYIMKQLKPGQRSARFDIMVRNDTIGVQLHSSFHFPKIEGSRVSPMRHTSLYDQVVIKPWCKKTAKYVFPEPCEYDITLGNRICPKCEKTDMVKVFFRGHLYIGPDDEPEFWNGIHVDDGEPQSCQPNWYCERDSLPF